MQTGTSDIGISDHETAISYYTPAFFRVFADFTKDNSWTKLADDTYTVLNNAVNKTTGLVPDWHSFAGGQPGKKYTYAYDACRVPLANRPRCVFSDQWLLSGRYTK